MFKKLVLLSFSMAVILGCQLLGTETQVPSAPPQETAKPADTAILEPTVIPPTETSTPEPTPPRVLQSGDLLYETTFDDFADWEIDLMGNKAEYANEVRSDGLYVKVPDDNDYWYAYYYLENVTNDVLIETDAELVGDNNYTYIAMVCRSSEKGEYVFYLDTGGYWQIGKFDFEADSYEQLGYGGSTRIKVAKDTNHIAVTCEGNELTMVINDYTVGSAQDSQFTDGEIGIGVETFDFPLTEVIFHNLEVYVP